MVQLEEAVIARYSHAGHEFELLVDPALALKMKKGQSVSLDDLLAAETIFVDARKGKEQSEAIVKEVFGTNDIREIAPKIIKEGEVQLTTEQRKELREQKWKEIIDFISRNAVNPQTNSPHPPARIEIALNEAKVHVDEFKDTAEQVNEILPKLRRLLPISMEKSQIGIKIPPSFVAKALNILHRYDMKKQEWQNDGSLIAVVELAAGMRQELFDKLNHLSHGEIVTKLLDKPTK
jgi:ribosome maturation protein SDO1